MIAIIITSLTPFRITWSACFITAGNLMLKMISGGQYLKKRNLMEQTRRWISFGKVEALGWEMIRDIVTLNIA